MCACVCVFCILLLFAGQHCCFNRPFFLFIFMVMVALDAIFPVRPFFFLLLLLIVSVCVCLSPPGKFPSQQQQQQLRHSVVGANLTRPGHCCCFWCRSLMAMAVVPSDRPRGHKIHTGLLHSNSRQSQGSRVSPPEHCYIVTNVLPSGIARSDSGFWCKILGDQRH